MAAMILKQKGAMAWLEFEQFQEFPELIHGVFIRPYNYRLPGAQRVLEELFDLKGSARGQLAHGKEVVWVEGPVAPVCDGIVTNQRDLGLVVTHADCQVALFYDPIQRAVAGIHCGWRGNVQNIYAEAVSTLCKGVGSRPEDLVVCVSPSLGPEHSEFIDFEAQWPRSLWKYQFKPKHFDLWAIAHDQLIDAGVLSHHIEIASMCTYADKDRFFSYRRDKKTGRHATVIAVKSLGDVS